MAMNRAVAATLGRHAIGGATSLLLLLLLQIRLSTVTSWTSPSSRPSYPGGLKNPRQRQAAIEVLHPGTFLQNPVTGVRRRAATCNAVLLLSSSSSSSSRFSSSSSSSASPLDGSTSTVFKTTALAIVPPEDAWDTIQRARYMAGDPSYQQWPPCLRLFYYQQKQQQKYLMNTSNDKDMMMMRITDDPLRIAAVVEKYNVAPFTVRLSRWTILPHAEVILYEKQQQRAVAKAQSTTSIDSSPGAADAAPRRPLSEFDVLVAQEEAIGRRNLKKRLQRKAEAAAAAAAATTPSVAAPEACAADDDKSLLVTSPKDKKDKKQDKKKQPSTNTNQAAESFNGPCVICLEPDAASTRRISNLRLRILQELVANDDDGGGTSDSDSNSNVSRQQLLLQEQQQQHVCSPTATVTPLDIISSLDTAKSAAATAAVASATSSISTAPPSKEKKDDDANVDKYYRPVVPIGSFPTVQQAVAVLGHLQALWDPLVFTVTDLQVVSCRTTLTPTTSTSGTAIASGDASPLSSFGGVARKQQHHQQSQQQQQQQQQEQVGCDALIMLQGQEVVMDAQLNAEMANFIATRGQMGGYEAASATTADKRAQMSDGLLPPPVVGIRIDDLNLADGDITSLQDWLWQEEDGDKYIAGGGGGGGGSLDPDDNDDHDEGTVVVLGRTHFFTGDMRSYVGMPAESIPLRGSSASGTRSISPVNKKSSTNSPTPPQIVLKKGDIRADASGNDKENDSSWTITGSSSSGNSSNPVP